MGHFGAGAKNRASRPPKLTEIVSLATEFCQEPASQAADFRAPAYLLSWCSVSVLTRQRFDLSVRPAMMSSTASVAVSKEWSLSAGCCWLS